MARIVLAGDGIFGELRMEIGIAAVDLEPVERPRDGLDFDSLDPRFRRVADDDAAQRDELRDLEVRIVGAERRDIEPQAAVEPVGLREIGSGSWRERGGQYVYMSVGAV